MNLNKPLRHAQSHLPMRYIGKLNSEYLFGLTVEDGDHEVLIRTNISGKVGTILVVENVPDDRITMWATYEGGLYHSYEQAFDMTKHDRLAQVTYHKGELHTVEVWEV